MSEEHYSEDRISRSAFRTHLAGVLGIFLLVVLCAVTLGGDSTYPPIPQNINTVIVRSKTPSPSPSSTLFPTLTNPPILASTPTPTPTPTLSLLDSMMSFGIGPGGPVAPPASVVPTYPPTLTGIYSMSFITTGVDLPFQAGRWAWDEQDETVRLDISNGSEPVRLNLGQEILGKFVNKTGTTITNGVALRATGSQGQRVTAAPADSQYITTTTVNGLSTQTVLNNQTGFAATYGIVRDLNTSAFAEGAIVYLGANGVLTTTPPTSGFSLPIARVLISGVANGAIIIDPRPAPYWGNLQSGNYTSWDYKGYQEMEGLAEVWDDLRVPASSARVNPVQNKPDFEPFIGGTRAYSFDPSTEESVYFAAQMPHAWALGTDIHPHVHWAPSSGFGGNVVWGLECTISPISGTFGSTFSYTLTQAAGSTSYFHKIKGFDWIDMSSYTTVSVMLNCRLYRDATSTDDTYVDEAFLLETDFHYRKDSLGSPQEIFKPYP